MMKISLELNFQQRKGKELLNNYGLKSNAELILGYGFSITDNPDGRVVIKLGGQGTEGMRTEIDHDLGGLEQVISKMKDAYLQQIRTMTRSDETMDVEAADVEEVPEDWECELEVLDMLREMIQNQIAKLEACDGAIAEMKDQPQVRAGVARMSKEYIEGEDELITEVWEYDVTKINLFSHLMMITQDN
jgi:hypothetical protein